VVGRGGEDTASAGRPGGGSADVEALVRRAQAGELAAWGQLYQTFFAPIYRHVRFLTGSEAHAEDLVQEVFARALVKLSTFDDRASFSTWLHGIAINTVRNHWRSCRSTADAHRRLEAIHAVRGSTDDRMDQVQLCRERARLVYTILETLPDHLREAFVLRDLEGLSPGEAAAQLGISAGNFSVRATRARERIRKELEALGVLEAREARP
jgi:RNA polymerase sigma-70 factor, ECF subfamily